MGELAKIEKWLDDEEQSRLALHRKLVVEDAPKNRFSIVTGELRMIEAVRQYVEQVKRERDS